MVAQAENIKENPDLKFWMYKRIDGEVRSRVADSETCHGFHLKGWRNHPLEFATDEQLLDAAFQEAVNQYGIDFNLMLNLRKMKCKDSLIEFSKRYLQHKVNPKRSLKVIINQIEQIAKKRGKLIDAKRADYY